MNCPVCGKEGTEWAVAYDVEYQTSVEPYVFNECPCGVLYLVEPPSDRLSSIYPTSYYSYTTGSRNLPERVKEWSDRRKFRRALEEIDAHSIRVLDVGGGSGYYSDVIRLADSRVSTTTVVDLDPSLRQVVESKGHEFVNSRIESARFERGFHVIMALNLIEHVEQPQVLLARLREMLEPGGVLLLQTPNYRSLDAIIFRRYSWGGLHTPRHWVLFSNASLTATLRNSGYGSWKITHIQGAPFWAVGVLSRWQWLRSKSERNKPMYRSRSYKVLLIVFGTFDVVRSLLRCRTSQMYVEARR